MKRREFSHLFLSAVTGAFIAPLAAQAQERPSPYQLQDMIVSGTIQNMNAGSFSMAMTLVDAGGPDTRPSRLRMHLQPVNYAAGGQADPYTQLLARMEFSAFTVEDAASNTIVAGLTGKITPDPEKRPQRLMIVQPAAGAIGSATRIIRAVDFQAEGALITFADGAVDEGALMAKLLQKRSAFTTMRVTQVTHETYLGDINQGVYSEASWQPSVIRP